MSNFEGPLLIKLREGEGDFVEYCRLIYLWLIKKRPFI